MDGSQRVAVSARDVSVTYHVYEDRRPSLRRFVADGFRPRASRAIPALRHVSFEVEAGEAVGVIGPNGSGKSTLLRALGGLLPVTEGAVYARGAPVLLGVGAVLQPELSGRRNIMLGALALGLKRLEVEDRLDEIIDFAGLREFIDLPLKAYSSGMVARLHFATATAVRPEILLIDEALTVGDAEFRERSDVRIAELRERASTVFLVSHSMAPVRRTCSRVLWLDRGALVGDGPPSEIISAYESQTRAAGGNKRT